MGLDMDLTDLAELFADWDNDISEHGLFIVYDGRQSQLTQDFDLLKGDLILICKPDFLPAKGTTMLFRDNEFEVLDEPEAFPMGAPDFNLFRICYLTQHTAFTPPAPTVKVFADPEGFQKVIITMHNYNDSDPRALEKIFHHFEVWRSTDAVTYHCIGTPRIGMLEDSVVTAGTTYYYKVRMVDRYSRIFNQSSPISIVAPMGLYPIAISHGWIFPNETWIYASADAPTFTFTIAGDVRYKYSPGMRIKLTQSAAIKYFIITAVSYSSPNTIVTVYGGTDYTLENASIADPAYSYFKAPYGFPLDPAKWMVEVMDTTQRSQSSPTQNQWYNLGSISIAIPLGVWYVTYKVTVQVSDANVTSVNAFSTLSIANDTESDADFTTFGALAGASGTMSIYSSVHVEKVLSLSSKTSYYINSKTSNPNVDNIYNRNDIAKLIIRVICAYL